MGFDANQRTVAEIILTGEHIVPRYQRPYAWDEENILDLWKDLRNGPTKGHFIGNMVVYPSGGDRRDIVDGQQRLTTVLIAIRALKDAYEKIGETGRSQGLAHYLQRVDLSGETVFRLQHRTESGYLQLNIFSESSSVILGKEPKSNAEKAQYAAYRIFTDEIVNEVKSDPDVPESEVLDRIRDRFIRATVVYVLVDDRQSAFQIFETLNDRGKSLNQVDLVKNQVISAIPASASREEETLWAKSIEHIETSSWLKQKVKAEDFIGYAWNSTSHQADSEHVATNRIRRSVEAYLNGEGTPEANATEFIRFFHQTAEIFKEFDRTLASPNGKHWEEVVPAGRWRSDKFALIDNALYGCLVPNSTLPLNLLFSLLRNYIHCPGTKIAHARLLDFLRVIECLQFRWSIAQRPSTSTIRRAYRRAAYAVDNAPSKNAVNAALADFKEDANSLMPTDSQFKDGLRRLTYFTQRPGDIHRVRRTLQEVERHWGSSSLPANDPLTLEHIESQGGKSINSRQNFWVGKLGNLMLLPMTVNSSLPQNFDQKCAALGKWANAQDLVLHAQINLKVWDNSAANQRMNEILDTAVLVWPKELA
ncbi:DUF262 domain-containing protein [Dietzia sp. DQ11-71]|nr:DUF262 domain-containing protein [Dietzia sp. DQ11-71]MBB1018373.1 DUF262 domain-containing protein [Dietzia sp. DQ11-71]